MNLQGKRIAILVHNYFEQAEFERPLKAFEEAGAEVTVISADKKNLTGLNHIDKGDEFEADLMLSEASSGDYDGLVLPGGVFNSDQLRVIPEAQAWVTDFLDSGRPVAVICHAPWTLVSADLVEGRRLTSFATIRDDIINAGGDWVDLPVVEDDNLITSRQPDDIPAFNEAFMRQLARAPVLTR